LRVFVLKKVTELMTDFVTYTLSSKYVVVLMVNPVHPMFIFAKRFFKKGFLDFGPGIIFQPAHEIDLFICPFCKLPVIVIGFVEDQHAAF